MTRWSKRWKLLGKIRGPCKVDEDMIRNKEAWTYEQLTLPAWDKDKENKRQIDTKSFVYTEDTNNVI